MSRKLTILLAAPQPFFQERGTPIAVRMLSEALAEMGHRVHLLVYHEGDDVKLQGVFLHRIAAPGWINGIRPGLSWKKIICDIYLFREMNRLGKTLDFDLIHAVEEAVFPARILAARWKIPYVYDMDSSLSGQIIDKFPWAGIMLPVLERLEKFAIRASIGVVAVCRDLEDKVKVMAPEIPVLRLEDVSMLDESRQGDERIRKDRSISGMCFLYIGNLEKYQGIDLLLRGFALALRQGISADLVIIGGEDDHRRTYQDMARHLKIDRHVHFLGPRPLDMLGYYLTQADVLVSPRIQGGNTPMKLYSYLDSGRPILATDLSTHTQVLDRRVACLVNADPEAMAHGMIRL